MNGLRTRAILRKTPFILLCSVMVSAVSLAQTSPSSSPPSGTVLLELPTTPSTNKTIASAPLPSVSPPALPTTVSTPSSLPSSTSSGPAASSPLTPTPPAPVPTIVVAPVPAPLSKDVQAIIDANREVIFEPLHLGNVSIIFNKVDRNNIMEALKIYDSSRGQKTATASPAGEGKDSLSSLLDSLRSHEDTGTAAAPPPSLPNLYLGSIVYYSPSNWSIWVNDKKLTNKTNTESNELYVTRISRTEAELRWRPYSLMDIPTVWQMATQNGQHPLPHILVDEHAGEITLDLHPNQTFLPKSLTIREGLIKSTYIPPSTPPHP